ncbi:cation:proton antiporter regulatory subunit [Thermocrinis minervae]|uniref:Potassium/proton antiporter regulatory subunit, CPA2 family n=1 Tax=Thermocrinis minervae TaxID=381751 RepID=A0A1M6R8H1_9AQUI|nr:cation:proton antiporter regulatory subunit [Thermocrinis minervae]SHK28726.1 potassium/proton antiporter regulatory subunit, CPA2 family [Thermocrinis minervae]
MKIKETDLPGVGKKYSIELKNKRSLVLVIYHTGKRELFIMEEEEPLCFFELTDEEAKELGFLIAGALYEPVRTERMEMILKQMVMEWIRVGKNSNLVGKTIAELQIRSKTGASVIAISRDDQFIPTPDPYKEIIKEGDLLIVVGTRQQINNFLELCGHCEI